ncbi:hypothetical protein NPIL_689441 [Nephila pilipes]|uniref:Uncharacterized protein n=1 Tax=Nephila pilipes TaxID=299642 RepID=A0A8X6UG30_NEPPI|nr:hypothetical protein NPIL_689441 [Nephila pilipes]
MTFLCASRYHTKMQNINGPISGPMRTDISLILLTTRNKKSSFQRCPEQCPTSHRRVTGGQNRQFKEMDFAPMRLICTSNKSTGNLRPRQTNRLEK